MMAKSRRSAAALLAFQALLLMLFALFTRYDKEADARKASATGADLAIAQLYPSRHSPAARPAMSSATSPEPRRPPPRSRSSASASLSLAPRRRPATWWPRSASGSFDRPRSQMSQRSFRWTGSAPSRSRARVGSARGVAAPGRRQPQDVVLGLTLLYCEAALVCLYLGLVRYDRRADASEDRNSVHPSYGGFPQHVGDSNLSLFQDVHVMIFVGFGFLMMFLKKYGFSAVGFTLLLAALMVQWGALCSGFFRLNPADSKVHLSITSLLNADIATAAVLISMGAVLGKTTPLQLVVMGTIEMVFFAGNEYLGGHVFKAVDLGGSMFVHVFGAYFGLAVSRVLGRPSTSDGGDNPNEGSSYTSDMFAMVGTVFLWLFWPSFNGALASGHARHRAIINTYLALASCCVTAFAVSSFTQRDSKFNMVHVQNATLAGGVAVGTAADLMVQPVGALVIGCLAGALSVLGYAYLQPVLLKRLKVHDTCGVHNLHGMPGVMAGVIGAIMAAIATTDTYGNSLYLQFPARTPQNTTHEQVEILSDIQAELPAVRAGDGRTAGLQAAYQLLALFVTMAVSVLAGTATGVIMKQGKLFRQAAKEELFDDASHWELPEDSSPPATRKASASWIEVGGDAAAAARHHVTTVSAAVDEIVATQVEQGAGGAGAYPASS